MRILFDIVHPADVLFFRRAIDRVRARGDEILILSRHKDITTDLLDEYGIPHHPVSQAGHGVAALGRELLGRDVATYLRARRFRPDIMLGFGGVSISHVGKIIGKPSIAFYDSEGAALQNGITWPFISHLYVGQSYFGKVPEARTTRVAGIAKLAYLHSNGFTPNRAIAERHGLDPAQDNFIIRTVSWRANHDMGKRGWDEDRLYRLVENLQANGRVHLSSERALPPALEHLRYAGKPGEIHHLMAFCRLYVGESATMAAESALLGVPAIYAGHDRTGYTEHLEARGLLRHIPADADGLLDEIDSILARPLAETAAARDILMRACPDWTDVIVKAVDTHAAHARRAQQRSGVAA